MKGTDGCIVTTWHDAGYSAQSPISRVAPVEAEWESWHLWPRQHPLLVLLTARCSGYDASDKPARLTHLDCHADVA
ncbi:MAG: hypothetical protein ABSG53_06655 [Thermoguttaceae bacterium]